MPVNQLELRIANQKSQSLYRVRTKKSELINFCSNDYLSLSQHPTVKQACITALADYGVGAGASQLISGHHAMHQEVERAFAEFFEAEAALLFGSGYLANLGVITVLAQSTDAIFADKLNHASLIDAVRLSNANNYRYRHLDMEHLQQRLHKADLTRNLIVTDGVFSMDGDIAPVAELATISKAHNALLVIDDAHGIGVLGEDGRGVLNQAGLQPKENIILVCPFGKSLGGYGAMVLGDQVIIDALIQFARPYIYTTAIPVALAVAAKTSLQLFQQEKARINTLRSHIEFFKHQATKHGIVFLPSNTAIQSLVIGDAEKTMQVSQQLQQYGFGVGGIRPPTVPKQSSRLRVTLNVDHTEQQIVDLLAAISKIKEKLC